MKRGNGYGKHPFKEYLKESEPDKVSKGYAWSTAIGLQAVDGLKPSKYLIDTAIQNIEGKITLKETQNLIDSYYSEKPAFYWMMSVPKKRIRYLRVLPGYFRNSLLIFAEWNCGLPLNMIFSGKDFSYKGLSMDEIIHHLAVFVSRLWQIHIFEEGNTRTTAVFFIKYLRTLGFGGRK